MSGSNLILLGGSPKKAVVDPYFYSVTSLLHGDGTNGAQNNTFLDSSTNNFTITRNGNTTQGSFSPFSQTGWSNYFDGTGDYLSVADNAAFTLGTSDFCVESWVYPLNVGTGSSESFISQWSGVASGYGWIFQYRSNKVLMYYSTNGSNIFNAIDAAATISNNAWTHIAFVRSGNTLSAYVNGTRVSNNTSFTANIFDGVTAVNVGRNADNLEYVNGYLSNTRLVVGSSVYDPSQSTITVPTAPLTAVSNTKLLTCQANRFLDASSNAFAITRNGDVSVQPFSPFNPTTAYSTSAVGGSGYFDGSGDVLNVARNSAFDFGSGSLTLEAWVYITAYPPVFGTILGQPQTNGTAGNTVVLGVSPAGAGQFYAAQSSGGYAVALAAGTIPRNTWTHLAGVRNGNVFTLYINGTSVGSTTQAITLTQDAAAGGMEIGGSLYFSNYYSTGYICDARVVKGTAVYTANFTPPIAPLTAITNTSLLTNFTNAGIFDNAADADYETVGNAQISTSVKKYGTGSMAFDGTNDYLATNAPSTQLQAFGTGDFTVEMWVYFTAIGTNVYHFYDSRPTSTDGAYPTLRTNASAQLEYVANSAVRITGMTLTTGVWYHIALCRVASQTKLFVNGTQTGSTYADTTNYLNAALRPFIGGSGFHVTTLGLSGYIDDCRISLGVGRYPYNFTPPTAEFPNIGGTVTLTADPYYDYTTLLLPGNGTNGAQNNTFLDSSTNNFTITRNGNTTQGTFSPFSQTGWGNYFDGTGDYLSATSNAAFALSGDFTWEAWVYPNSWANTYHGVFYAAATGGLWIGKNGSNFVVRAGNVADQLQYGTLPPLNYWTHVVAVRSGTTLSLFFNGARVATATNSYSFAQGQANIAVDTASDGNYYNGYISNLRLVKGSAVYDPTASTLTVPTSALTAITNTSLLTCQSNRFVDNSSNAFAITRNGDVSVQAFSPFNPTAAWSAATYGGSGYFDGSGDYLNGPSTGQFAPTGDFTISMWIYPTSFAASFYVLAGSWNAGAANEWLIQYDNTGAIRFLTTTDSTFSAAGVIKLNQWQFLSISRTGSTLTGYVNGTSFRSYTLTGTVGSATKVVYIGAQQGTTWPYIGYMADFRMVAGSAESATPPTAPATAISGTNMLLNFTNAGIYDATSKNDLETVGNAQISTTQSKFGGSSMYFDGAGDWLIGRTTDLASFGTGDFTIEGWLYPSAVTGADRCLWDTRASSGDAGMVVFIGTAGTMATFTSNSVRVVSTTALSANTWAHFALVRYAGTLAFYINGVQSGTLSYTTAITCPGRISVAVRFDDLAPYTGYIDDLRITKGIARYTSNFTPPTTAFLTL